MKALQRTTGLPATPASQADDSAISLAGLRGEWLALQWHNALRAAGQPGLDTVLQRLLLAPALARHEGPISAPLATHRLVAALRPVLGDAPLRDIQRQAERAEPATLGPTSLGPCFTGAAGLTTGHGVTTSGAAASVMQYQPVPQALQQADCQGWLGLGPQALVAHGSSRLRSAAHAVDPDTAAAPRRASKAVGLKKGKGLHGGSGKAGARAAGNRAGISQAKAGKGHAGKAGSTKTKAGKTTGKTTGSKPGKTKAGTKKASKH